MASKKPGKLESDEWDLDGDLDMPDFDFDAVDPPDNRSPTTKIATSFAQGAKDTVMSGGFLRSRIKNDLPKGYGKGLDMMDQGANTLRQLYNTGAKEAAPMISDMKRLTKRMMPTIERFTPKSAADKIRAWSDEQKKSSGPSVEEIRESGLQSQLGEIFAAQAKDRDDQKVEKEARDTIREQISQVRHRDQISQLDAIRQSTSALQQYQDKITSQWQRKSLELQYRHYFVAMDALEEQKKQNVTTTEHLANIAKNTGLPEYVKITQSERVSEILRSKFISGMADSIFDKRRGFMRNFQKNLVTDAQRRVRDFSDNMRNGFAMADSMLDMQEMQAEMGGGPSAGQLAGSMAGGMVADSLGGKLGKWLGGKAKQNKSVRKWGNKFAYAGENLPQMAWNFAKSDKYDDLPLVGGLFRMLKDAAGNGNADYSMHRDEAKDMQGPSIFSNQTRKTINEVIPGFLAKIYQELQIMRTGDSSIDLVRFDFSKNKFSSEGDSRMATFNSLFSRSDIDSHRDDVEKLLSNLDPENTKLSPEARAALGSFLFRDNMSNNEGSAKRLSDFDTYNGSAGKHADELAGFFTEYFKGDDEDSRKLQFSQQFNQLGRGLSDAREKIQMYMNLGMEDQLRDIGIIDEDGRVDQRKMLQYWNDEDTYKYQGGGPGGKSRKFRGGRGGGRPIPPPPPFPNLPPPSNPGGGGGSGGFKADCCEELKKAINETSAKGPAEKMVEILTRIEEGLKAGVNLNITDQDADPNSVQGRKRKRLLDWTFGDGVNAAGDGLKWGWDKGTNVAGRVWGGAWGNAKKLGGGIKDLFGKGKDWAKGKIDDLSDVYVELNGKVQPLLTSYKLRAGKYVDEATGQVITKWSQATGAIRDTETGELITVEQMKDAFSKTKYGKALFEKVKDLKDWGVEKLGQGFSMASSFYGAGWQLAKKAYDLLDRPCDVYVPGQEEPVLLAITMKGGGYWSKTNGHAITKPSLIDGPVVNENKEEILTEEMLKKGLFDQFGVPLKTGWKKIAQYALTGALKGWDKLKGAGKWLKDKATGLWNGGIDGIADMWGRITGPDGIMIAGGTKMTNVLVDIYNLLDARMPGTPTGLHAGDGSSGSGGEGAAAGAARLRDGIKNRFKEAKVEEKVAKARKKLEIWGDRAKKVVGDATGDGVRDGSLKDQALKAKELAKEKALSGADALRGRGKNAYDAAGGALGALLERFEKRDEEEEESSGDTNIDLGGGGEGRDKEDRGERTKGNKRRPGESHKQYRARVKAEKLRRKAVRDRYNRINKVGRLGKAAQTGRAAAGSLGRGALALGRGGLMAAGLMGEGALGAASLAGSAAMGLGSAAVSAASAIGSGAMWLGSAALGFLSAPVVLGALAVGGLAVAGYYGYKYLTKKRLKPLNTVRYAQYGFLAADEDHLQAVMGLEDKVKKGLKFEGDVATLSMEGLDVKAMSESFGVNLKDRAAVNSWFFWFRDRFKPVYLTAQTAIRRTNKEVSLDDADSKLSPTEKQTYLNLAKFLEGPYSVTYNPFSPKEPLKAGYQEVKTAVDLAQASIEKELKDKPASGAEKLAQAAVLGKGVASAGEMKTAEDERLGKDKVAAAEREARAKQMQNNRMLIGGGMGMSALTVKGEQLPKSRIAGGRIDALTCVRYKTYGLKEMELPRVRAMDSLEEAVEKDIDFSGDGIAVWKGDPKAMLAAQGGSFGIDGISNSKAYDWLTWFNYRFLPAYLNYATAMFRNTNRKKPSQGLNAMKPTQAVDIATVIYTTTSKYDSRGLSVWNVTKSPWADYELNTDVKSIDDNMKALKDAAKSAVLGETKGRIDASTLAKPENALLAKTQKQYGKVDQIDFNKNPSILMANVEKGRGMMAANSGFAGGLTGAQGMGYSMIPGGTGSYSGGQEVQHPGNGTGGDVNSLPASQKKGWANQGPIILGAAKMAGFDPNLMASIAAAESGFDPNIGAGSSTAVGLFQFISKDRPGRDSTWTSMKKKYGKKYGISMDTPPTDARANALLGAEYMKENLAYLKGKLGRPITDTDIYMGHFLGAGGATKFLKANPNTIAAELMPDAAGPNAPIFYHDPKTRTRPKTTGEIYQHFTNLIKTRKAEFGVPANLGGGSSIPSAPAGMPAANDPSGAGPKSVTSNGAAGSSVPPLLAPMAAGGGAKAPSALPDFTGKGPTVEEAKAKYANQQPTKAGLDAAAAGRAATEAAMAEDEPKPKAPASMPNALNVATRNLAPAPAVVAASSAAPEKAAQGPSSMPQEDDTRSVQGFLPPSSSSPRYSGPVSDGAKSADIDKLGATIAAGNDYQKTQVDLLRDLVTAVKDLKTGLNQSTSSTVPTPQRAQGQMPNPPISLRRAQ